MAEFTPTFEIKRDLVKPSSPELGGNKLPLKDLATDEKTVKDFEFYFRRITTGQVSSLEELQARIEARTVNTRDGKFLTTSNGSEFLLNKSGDKILIRDSENLPIKDKEQADLLVDLFKGVTEFRDGKKQADDEVRGFDFYVRRITTGQVSSLEELQARIEARTVNTRDGKFLTTSNGSEFLLNKSGDKILIRDSENLPIKDKEQADLLVDLFKLTKDESLTGEERLVTLNYVLSGEKGDLGRLNLLIERGEGGMKRIGEVVGRFDSFKSRLDLKRGFFEELIDQKSVRNALELLERFEGREVKDLRLTSELRNLAFQVNRADVASEFVTAIAQFERDQFNGDLNTALDVASRLTKSAVPGDLELGLSLSRVAYRLEIATFKDRVREMIRFDRDPKEIYKFIDGLPIRPGIGEIDYVETWISLKRKLGTQYTGIGQVARLAKANEIRRNFVDGEVSQVISQIDTLPNETQEDVGVKVQLFSLYRNYIATANPTAFDQQFAEKISQEIDLKLKSVFERAELGKNKEAFNYIRENFVRTFFPLTEVFRDDPRTKEEVLKLLFSENGEPSPRLKFIQKISELQKQRPLTDLEKIYIQSVELLTLFNPYLVAANVEFGVSREFLKHHFESVSKETLRNLKDGDYLPAFLVGTGPNGMAAFGEIVRNNPVLASQMLILDSGEQIGGPFAIPEGPAWELNSANGRGINGYTLPAAPNGREQKTVRALGSPLRWFPGERLDKSSFRPGSINTTIDYFIAPDVLSNKRYPTNEELQFVLQEQAALLVRKLALKTTLLSVEPNPNKNEKGNKIATIRTIDQFGNEKIIRVKTDAIFNSTGLGEPTYGFKLEGSKAETVIEKTKGLDVFPRISTTLEAFNALASRVETKKSPGETLVIYGKGNSADTLIEFIGNIFQGDNPLVRGITKIYVISDGDLSARPRYSLIKDLKPRNGGDNLIEQVYTRVGDVDFASVTPTLDPAERKLVFYDDQGNAIRDKSGNLIQADSAIAATGFRPNLDKVYESYLKVGQNFRNPDGDLSPVERLTLPTNEAVAVADVLKADSSIVFLGTSSKSRFDLEKLAQLPKEAREALLRNGAENAVAIGFRAPDTQAALNIWLNSRFVNIESEPVASLPKVPLEGPNSMGRVFTVEQTLSKDELKTPNDIVEDDLLLSSLLAYNVGSRFELSGNFTGDIEFELTYDGTQNKFLLKFSDGDIAGLSSEFVASLLGVVSDDYFQRYSLSKLSKIRKKPKLLLQMAFKRGKIDPGNTLVQPK